MLKCGANRWAENVSFWLGTDIQPPEIDFRFAPKRRHFEAHASLPPGPGADLRLGVNQLSPWLVTLRRMRSGMSRGAGIVEERVQRRLVAILAADVVGYSRLMGED